uniref:Alternative protein TMEM14A n=1 Tax=Homo sapiens TaxID=9606 RepID=L0R8I9_HUMAN|nr:alternative protein TMEM14A [Homo sapiens]
MIMYLFVICVIFEIIRNYAFSILIVLLPVLFFSLKNFILSTLLCPN